MALNDRERRALDETAEFGVVDPDAAKKAENKRRNLRARNNRGSNTKVQPESSTPGRSNPPMNPAMSAADRTVGTMAEGISAGQPELSSEPDSLQGLEDSQVIASASPDSKLSYGRGVMNLRNRDTNAGGTVTTIPSESFVNPAYTGIRSGENIARAVRKQFNQEQRQKAIDSDMEWRRNLRQRRLLDDANLRLSGDMSLTELADAASRRRAARTALREQEVLASERASTAADIAQRQQAADQKARTEIMKERGRNLRERAGIESEQEQLDFDRANDYLDLKFTTVDPEGNEVFNPQLKARTLQLISAAGKNPGNIKVDELDKIANTAQAITNIEGASGISIESMGELQRIIGFTDRELFEWAGDDPEIHLIDPDSGKLMGKVTVREAVRGSPAVRRLLKEAQQLQLELGNIPFTERQAYPRGFGQRAHPDYNKLNDPEGAQKRQEEAIRRRTRRRDLGSRPSGEQIQNLR